MSNLKNNKNITFRLKKTILDDNISMADEDQLLKSDDESSNNNMLSILRSIKSDTSNTNSTLNEYMKSTDAKLDGMNKSIGNNSKQIATLTNKVNSCQKIVNEVNFTNEIHKQQALKNNISLYGIPFTDNENLMDIVAAVHVFFGIEFQPISISSCYRVKNSVNLIIVKFKNHDDKDKLMKAKLVKSMKLSDISENITEDSNIYINNHTSPYFGKLLYHARQAVKQGKLHSAWVSSNGFLVKQTESSSPTGIRTIDQLNDFLIKIKPNDTNKRNRNTSSPSDELTNPTSKFKQGQH